MERSTVLSNILISYQNLAQELHSTGDSRIRQRCDTLGAAICRLVDLVSPSREAAQPGTIEAQNGPDSERNA